MRKAFMVIVGFLLLGGLAMADETTMTVTSCSASCTVANLNDNSSSSVGLTLAKNADSTQVMSDTSIGGTDTIDAVEVQVRWNNIANLDGTTDIELRDSGGSLLGTCSFSQAQPDTASDEYHTFDATSCTTWSDSVFDDMEYYIKNTDAAAGRDMDVTFLGIRIEYTPVANTVPHYTTALASNISFTEWGGVINYTATGDDPDTDNYRLTVCNATGITDGYPGTCSAGNTLCTSAVTADDGLSSCSYTTLIGDIGNLQAFGYLCDAGSETCNSTYANANVTVGAQNTTPVWTVALNDNVTTLAPGEDINYTGTGTDADSNNYRMTVCDAPGITNGYPGTCTSATYCTSAATASGSQASCTYTAPTSSSTYARNVTLNSTVAVDLTNFPARIELDTQALISAGKMRGDCADLAVYNDSDTLLSYEIENVTCNTTKTIIWAKIPTLGNNTPVRLRYGNLSASTLQNVSDTWSQNYTNVYHVLESAWSGTSFDSSGGDWNATYQETGGINTTACKFGNCWSFHTNGRLFMTTPDMPNANTTISLWWYPYDMSSYHIFIGDDGTVDYYWYAAPPYNWTRASVGFAEEIITPQRAYFPDTFSFVHLRSQDGNQTVGSNNTPSTNNTAHVGLHGGTGNYICDDKYSDTCTGMIDEYRISDVRRSDEWLIAEYQQTATLGTEYGETADTSAYNLTAHAYLCDDGTNQCNATFTALNTTVETVEPPLALNITSCQELTDDATLYTLTANISNADVVVCMNVTGKNITLDCINNIIDGDTGGGKGDYGVLVDYTTETGADFTIQNCEVSDWHYGIYLENITGATITNITAYGSDQRAISVTESTNVTISYSNLSTSKYGVTLKAGVTPFDTTCTVHMYNTTSSDNTNSGLQLDCSRATIENNTLNNNAFYGINLGGANNTIRSNIIQGNNGALPKSGIRAFSTSKDNYIYNNYFNNTLNIQNDATGNHYNTTQQTGTRIYTLGTDIGGNYWTNASGDGFSDTCTNVSGFCSTPLNISTMTACTAGVDCGDADYLVLTNNTGSTCSSFAAATTNIVDCTDACTIDTPRDMLGNNFNFTGSGTITMTALITNWTVGRIASSCVVRQDTGGGFHQ